MRFIQTFSLLASSLSLVVACGGGGAVSAGALTPLTPVQTSALLAAADRTEADRKVDGVRHPDQLLAFLSVGPGMHVADLGAGGGYTTELLARAVGPSGAVYSQNDPDLLKRFLDKPFTERLARPINKNVVRVERTFDDPLPPDAQNLDVVVMYIFYHDVVWIGADRDKMNKAIFAALKPGGAYVVVDASANAADGIGAVKTLHRIDEGVVRAEVAKAGFVLADTADFLRNPSDARDWNSSPRAAADRLGTEDRFVLKFVKPRSP
jgi:predicted methyltransferase